MPNHSPLTGHVKLESHKKRMPRPWHEIAASLFMPLTPDSQVSSWQDCHSVTAITQDVCRVGTWIFAQSTVCVHPTQADYKHSCWP